MRTPTPGPGPAALALRGPGGDPSPARDAAAPPEALRAWAAAEGWSILGGAAAPEGWSLVRADGEHAVAVLPTASPGEVARAAGVRHEHLVRVRDVVVVEDGCLVLLDAVDGVRLDELARARSGLRPAEIVTLGVALARALAALHAAGVVAGGPVRRDVLVTFSGHVSLAPRSLGDAPRPRSGETAVSTGVAPTGPEDDVAALGSLLSGLLATTSRSRRDGPECAVDDDARSQLARVLDSARADDPARQPAAGTLAAWIDAVAPGEAIAVPDAAVVAGAVARDVRSMSRAPRPARRAPPRTRVIAWTSAAVAVIGLGAAVLAVGAASPSGPARDLSVTRTTAGVASDPVLDPAAPEAAAGVLTARRIAAIARGSVADDVVYPGSAAETADRAVVAALAAGTSVRGVSVTVLGTRIVDGADTAGGEPFRATVEVSYSIGAHTQVAAEGVETRVPASGPQSADLVLRWTDQGWRVESVA